MLLYEFVDRVYGTDPGLGTAGRGVFTRFVSTPRHASGPSSPSGDSPGLARRHYERHWTPRRETSRSSIGEVGLDHESRLVADFHAGGGNVADVSRRFGNEYTRSIRADRRGVRTDRVEQPSTGLDVRPRADAVLRPAFGRRLPFATVAVPVAGFEGGLAFVVAHPVGEPACAAVDDGEQTGLFGCSVKIVAGQLREGPRLPAIERQSAQSTPRVAALPVAPGRVQCLPDRQVGVGCPRFGVDPSELDPQLEPSRARSADPATFHEKTMFPFLWYYKGYT